MTPAPSFPDIESLNEYLLDECRKDLSRPSGRAGSGSRGELLSEARSRFLPLPGSRFDACRRVSSVASKQSLVRFDKNDYSVPVQWAYHPVTLKGYVDRVEIHADGERIATHERCYGAGEDILDFRHYIPLLERKPGGVHNARPFKGEPWGEDFSRLRTELEYRYGGEGVRKFVNVLLLFSEYPESEVKRAVRICVSRGAFSDEAVTGVLNYSPPRHAGRIDLSGRPELQLKTTGCRPAVIYDRLLGEEVLP